MPASGATAAWQQSLSASGLLRVQVEPRAAARVGAYVSWVVRVSGLDGQAVDVSLSVRGGMPGHGHGLPTAPETRRIAAGEFLLEGLMFNMPGAWVLVLDLRRPGAPADSAIFRFDLSA